MWDKLTAFFDNISAKLGIIGERISETPGKFLRKIEETAVGVAIAAVFYTVARYVPVEWDGALLLITGALLLYFKDYAHRSAWLIGVSLSWFLLFLGEPSAFGFGAAGLAALCCAELLRRVFLRWRENQTVEIELPFGMKLPVYRWVDIGVRLIVALVVPALLGFILFGAYGAIQQIIIPMLQPYALSFVKISPVVFALFSIIVEGFATLRAPKADDSNHWAATPVMVFIGATLFLPSHSTAAAAFCLLIGFGLSIFAYLDRSTFEKPHRSHKTFFVTTAVSLVFCGWFYVANNWDWFLKYQMANAFNVTQIDRLPQSTPGSHRLVPIQTATDFCVEGNGMTYTDILPNPRPIFIKNHLYWECQRVPSRVENHLSTYLTQGIEGFILVDGGKKGRFSTAVDIEFVYGEHSQILKSAFFARHQFSEMHPSVIGRTVNGEYYMLVPYTSYGLHWGGMIPVFSGVMVVSPSGLIVDMTPSQAAQKFPGVPLYPTALSRQYAQLWAENSSWFAIKWSGELLEISDSNSPEDNLYPNFQSFVTGDYGMIPFEPKGKKANSLKAIGLIDRVTGDMMVHFYQSKTLHDVSTSIEDQGLPGPRRIIDNVATMYPGRNNLKLSGATSVVSATGDLHWLSSLMQTDVLANHGFANGVLFAPHGDRGDNVETAEDVDAILQREDEAKRLREEALHPQLRKDAPAPKVEAPAPKVEAPAPKVEAPAPKVEAPAPKVEAPAPKVEAPAPKVEAPAPKVEAPAPEVEAPASRVETPMLLNSVNAFVLAPADELAQSKKKKHKKRH